MSQEFFDVIGIVNYAKFKYCNCFQTIPEKQFLTIRNIQTYVIPKL